MVLICGFYTHFSFFSLIFFYILLLVCGKVIPLHSQNGTNLLEYWRSVSYAKKESFFERFSQTEFVVQANLFIKVGRNKLVNSLSQGVELKKILSRKPCDSHHRNASNPNNGNILQFFKQREQSKLACFVESCRRIVEIFDKNFYNEEFDPGSG